MQIHYDASSEQLLVMLSGEIDHHTSIPLRTEIDTEIYAHMPGILILDFGDVTFMDSSGIGLIMGRYKILHPMGGELILQNPSSYLNRMLRMAGMDRLAEIRTITNQEALS